MNPYAILNSRKRAIIALVHTFVFLSIAAVQLARSHATAFSLHGNHVAGGVGLLVIYALVSTVLLVLLRISAHGSERLYFALCAGSALFGLLRIVFGDPVLHAAVLRVILLSAAALTGAAILRTHCASGLQNASPMRWQQLSSPATLDFGGEPR